MRILSLNVIALLLLLTLVEGCTIKNREGVEICCSGFSKDSNGNCVSNCNGDFDKSSKIVIIGAGASGIAAATRLLSHGFTNVSILEGQSRIGGRINTVPFGDDHIDLGAQWCHGEKNNVVYEMVKDKNLLDKSKTAFGSHLLIRSSSEVVSKENSEKLREIIDSCFEDEKELLKSYNDSLGAYVRDYFLNALKQEKYASIDKIIADEFIETFQKGLASNEGAKSTFDVSGKGNLHYVTTEGHQGMNWKGKGYITILNVLMESKCNDFGVLNKRIFFNQEVSDIKSHTSGVDVKCISGIEHEADHVIFTGSVGVLRDRAKSLFQPDLPANKISAIENLGFGTVNKIFLYFDKKWWNQDFSGFTILWKEKDLEELRKTEYAWVEGIFGFFTVNYQPNVLSGWAVGETALQIEKLPKSKQLEGIMYIVRKILSNTNIPQPIDFITTAWNSNPFARGSYSHRSMDTEAFDTGASDLAEPILGENQKPVLMFAGEATHSYYYSTVHGAIESGWREADRIYEYYCKSV
ncbi:hypothetical protein ACFFRR_004299 [Megaselia abdita]